MVYNAKGSLILNINCEIEKYKTINLTSFCTIWWISMEEST